MTNASQIKKALILGGGGPVGIAWESGLIAGFAESGIDLSTADFIAGTSAGSFVGALLASGVRPSELAAPYLGKTEAPRSPSELLTSPPDLTPLIGKLMESYGGTRPTAEVCAEIGAWALQASTMSEEKFLHGFPSGDWPARRYACAAIDAESGVFIQWEKESGVPLNKAVASSCAVPGIFPPVTIHGRRYIDGGMRSGTNADVAKGYGVVIVVSVAGEQTPEAFRRPLNRELEILRDSGSKVELIRPNAESLQAFGPNLMDHTRRPQAAAAGLKQGQAGLDALRSLWI